MNLEDNSKVEYIEEIFEAPSPKEAFDLAKRVYKDREIELVRAKQKLDSSGNIVSQITIKAPISQFDSLNSNKRVEFVSELLLKRGLDKGWLWDKLSIAPKEALGSEKSILNYLIQELDRSIYIKEERLDKKRVIMLVGTTGVGKSTTLVKLASRYSYTLKEAKKVAILNLDTYKVGAYEQLEIFANTLLIDYRSATTIEQLKKALNRFRDFDIILADTAGISPKDFDRLIKQIEFIKEIKDFDLEIELVIPANLRYSDIVEIYEYFSFLDISSAIITKLDETNKIGDLITFLAKSNLPVSYLSFGQKVPDDLMLASKSSILDCFVGDSFYA